MKAAIGFPETVVFKEEATTFLLMILNTIKMVLWTL